MNGGGCVTTTAASFCGGLPPPPPQLFCTLMHLTILPITIFKDNNQYYQHLSSSSAARQVICDDQPLHNPLSRHSDGGSQARRTAHLL